jgi:hypothetical protein
LRALQPPLSNTTSGFWQSATFPDPCFPGLTLQLVMWFDTTGFANMFLQRQFPLACIGVNNPNSPPFGLTDLPMQSVGCQQFVFNINSPRTIYLSGRITVLP